MSTNTTISISEARKKIFQLAKEVQRPSVSYTLTDKGRPKAVIISAQDFESWQETLEVINVFPN
jgi:prevent-host-death family protein